MKPSCLIVDRMHESLFPLLNQIGIVPDYQPEITPEQVLEIIHKYDGIVVRSKLKINTELLERASRLRFIARAGAGLDQIDVAEVEKRNVLIFNAPEGNRDALAEHTMALILSLLNNIVRSDKQVRSKVWDREGNRGFELKDKVVSLIGFGYMGRAVAARLKSFGCKLLFYDIDGQISYPDYVRKASLDEVFRETDILSLHIPLTSDSKGMVNYQFISAFEKKIWIINTARGEIVDLESLNLHLEQGKVLGAGLDVLENEKLNKLNEKEQEEFTKLAGSEKVILTPHVGGWSFESYVRINEVLVEKIRTSGCFN